MTILGFLGQIEFSYPEQYQAETLDMDLVVYFCHRMANVITELFTDQELTIQISVCSVFSHSNVGWR